MGILKGTTASFVNHLFQTVLITYLMLLLLEQLFPGFVSVYLNLNYLLALVILIGIIDVFSEHEIKEAKATKKDYFFIIALGILGSLIIFYKTKSLGFISYMISIIAGVLIILLSFLVLSEDKEEYAKMHYPKSKIMKWTVLGVILALVIIAIILPLFTSLTIISSFRIVFGSIFVLFLPGFIISFIFFPANKIEAVERLALSFALSIAIVPLVIFYLNLLGVKINLISSSIIIAGIIIISSAILYMKGKKHNY